MPNFGVWLNREQVATLEAKGLLKMDGPWGDGDVLEVRVESSDSFTVFTPGAHRQMMREFLANLDQEVT